MCAEDLGGLSEEHRDDVLSDMLYPLVAAANPALAREITGMLIKLSDNELLDLLMPQDPVAGAVQSRSSE